ncbi:MAG: substrate-binding domain-containing protein [Paracoccaceae bacterium]
MHKDNMAQDSLTLPQLLTTREVAELLRVKERKVYDMAAAGEIPHRRLTGKLLFPADEISTWISGERGPRPSVVGGSHDPLLDWAIRESGCGLSVLLGGSMDGLRRFQAGEVALAGMHVSTGDDWNLEVVRDAVVAGAVLIGWAQRSQGLILSDHSAKSVGGIADLAGRKLVLRQAGAGSRLLFDRLAAESELTVAADALVVRTENEAAEAVSSGEAEAALGLEAAARAFGLRFVPLVIENFDLLVDRRSYFTEAVQALLSFAAMPEFKDKAAKLGGYELEGLGAVRWLSR